MDIIINFVLSPVTENIILPLVILVLSVCAKSASKPMFSVEVDDFFVCFDLLVSSIFLFIIGMIDTVSSLIFKFNEASIIMEQKSLSSEEIEKVINIISEQKNILFQKISLSWLFLFALLLVIVILIFTTKKWGWSSTLVNGNRSVKINKLHGIIIPNIVALCFLVITTYLITS